MTFPNFTRHVKGRIKDTNRLPHSLVLHVPCRVTPSYNSPNGGSGWLRDEGVSFGPFPPFHLHACWAGGLHVPPAPPELRTAGRAQWNVPQTAFLILGPGAHLSRPPSWLLLWLVLSPHLLMQKVTFRKHKPKPEKAGEGRRSECASLE